MGFLSQLFGIAKDVAPGVIGGALAGGPVGAGLGLIKGIANQVLGRDPASELTDNDAQKIIADPQLYAEFRIRVQEIELEKERERTKQLQEETEKLKAVNATMQAESRSEHWPQFSWRPFNGFSYPVTVFAIYFGLPLLNRVVPEVSPLIWMGWLSILGVAVWDRGKEKRAAAGEHKAGLLEGAINAIRGGKS